MVGPTSGGGGGGGAGRKKSPTTVKTGVNDWRVIFLHAIGAPATSGNLAALQAWALSESGYNSTYGTNLAGPLGYNPLAISNGAGVPTVGMVNGIVVRFGSTQAGAVATARFMQRFGYSGVINALRNDDQVALYNAVNASGWCHGCQSGHYPIGLYNYINGGSVEGGGATFSGSSGRVPGDSSSGAATGQGSGGQGGGSGEDSGGLFGSCSGSTGHGGLSIGSTQITGNLFSTPSVGGIGCYLEQSLKFVGFTVGGAVLMGLGLGLVVVPSLRSKLGPAAALLAGPEALAGAVGMKAVAGESATAGEASAAAKGIQKAAADQRRDELHKEKLAQQRARTRVERSRARQEKLAEGSPTRLSVVEEARLKRAQGRVGNRPDRMRG